MGAKRLLRRLPIRVKLTVAYTVVIAVMISAIGLFLYLHFKSGVDGALNTALRARSDDVAAVVRQEGLDGLRHHRAPVAGGDLVAQVLNRQGQVLFSTSSGEDASLISPARARDAGPTDVYIDRQERDRFLVRNGPVPGTVLVVRASLDQRESALELLNGALLVGGGLTLLLTAAIGYALASAALRPMETMREAAAEISDADPGARLPLPLAEDEVHRLGVTLNEMLARLERARDREREFFSDASHELRTPLTILKSEVEIALRKDNPPQALRAALRVAGAETDRLINLAEDLLLVARSDAGAMELDRHAVPASAVLDGIERRFRVRARESGRSLTVGDGNGLTLDVDPTRVEQALSNLVENALRHGAGDISVVARASTGGRAELHVLDDGPGVPDDFLPHAFERFSRAQTGRSGKGTGLGLAIVQMIAQAHGSRAGLANRPEGGTDAWLELPTRPRAGAMAAGSAS
ncbi:MAG TPA: HAMP domain-containing sensor histidine kinase [Conexibacter sp.]|jgi:signal transduction histidine kinase